MKGADVQKTSPGGLRRYFLLSLLLVCTPLPLLLTLQYLGGGVRNCVPMFFGWMALAVLYWWPLGIALFLWKRGWKTRLVIGYLISLPLYFLCLFLIYPAFGAHFHPRGPGVWGIYFSQTPVWFVFTVTLVFLVRNRNAWRRITSWLTVVFFAFGITAPIVIAARTDHYTWPTLPSAIVNITNARIVDVSNRRILEGLNVHIKDGWIVALVPAAGDSLKGSIIDARGQYLLPGLIDVHTHLQAPVRSVLAPFDFHFLMECLFSDYAPQRRAYLENGVTAVRDVGGPATHAYHMRAMLESKQLLGPRLFVVGRLVTSPHGHPVSTIWNAETTAQGAILASDSSGLIAGLESNYRAGPPDAVKFIYGTIGLAKEKLARDLLQEGIRWASSRQLISIVHAETTEEVTEAARAGATGIEHVASIESLPEDLVYLLLEKKTFVDPTFGELDTALTLRHDDAAKRREILNQRYHFIRRLHQAGIRLVIGTDAPLVPYGTGLQDEFAHFLRAGFTPAEILAIDTQNNASYLGQADRLGQIAAGYAASFTLVHENPLDNIDTLRHPTWVMLQGEIVVRSAEQ
ncbi:MAG: amidohydrolase family protein [Acidobacteria bacterium]|nr:amidohydrolase family protein [Acidobacteriota bacterium]